MAAAASAREGWADRPKVGPLRRALGIPYPWPVALAWPLRYACPLPPRKAGFVPLPPVGEADGMHKPIATIAFLGDLMPTPADLRLDVDPVLTTAIAEADLVVANCESPLADTSDVRGVRFQFEAAAFARHVAALGAKPERLVVSVANNHSEDRGARALLETARRIEGMGARVVGLREQDDGGRLVTVAETGARVGLCAWTHWRNRPGGACAPRPWTTRDVEGADWRAAKRDLGLHFLIGFPHWDMEFRHAPQVSTRRLAAALASRGFDVLFGHHPHVVQGLERIGDSLVLYSGGNAISNDPCARRWPCRLSLVFVLDLFAEGPSRFGYRVLPYVYERSGRAARLRSLAGPSIARSREKGRFDEVFPTQPPDPSRT